MSPWVTLSHVTKRLVKDERDLSIDGAFGGVAGAAIATIT